MKRVVLIALLFAGAGCTGSNSGDATAGRSDTRQEPSNLTPGLHIGGYANVGVVRNF